MIEKGPNQIEASLASSTAQVSQNPVAPNVSTVSSAVPMAYASRVRFVDSIQHPGDSADNDNNSSRVSENSNNDLENLERAKRKLLPLDQNEPLAVDNFRHAYAYDNLGGSSGSLDDHPDAIVDAQPRIEIRLCRPRSMYNISDEVTKVDPRSSSADNLANDDENEQKSTPRGARRINRWLQARKLIRFASAQTLLSDVTAKANKGESDSPGTSPRPRTDSGSSSNQSGQVTDFFSRFMKKKPKSSPLTTTRLGRSNSKTLRVEIFDKAQGSETTSIQNTGRENKDHETIQMEKLNLEENGGGDTSANISRRPSHFTDKPRRDNNDGDAFNESSSEDECRENRDPALNSRAKSRHSNVTPSSSFRSSRPSVRLSLFHHFTTKIPAVGNQKPSAIIKDVTNVQPMKDGEVIVTDILSNKMVLFDSRGNPKVSFTLDEASEPWAACLTSDGKLAVTLRRLGCVSLWSMSGVPLDEFGHGVLIAPTGIQIDSRDTFVVTDEKLNTISIFNRQGDFLMSFLKPQTQPLGTSSALSTPSRLPRIPEPYRFNKPRYVCVTCSDHYVISDSSNHCVQVFDSSGTFCRRFGTFGQKAGSLRFPYGVASDSMDLIYVADYFNHRVSVFSLEGKFQYHALTSKDGITRPKGLAIHNSHLYVAYGDLRADKISVFNLPNLSDRNHT